MSVSHRVRQGRFVALTCVVDTGKMRITGFQRTHMYHMYAVA
jgi:hypothetical protein